MSRLLEFWHWLRKPKPPAADPELMQRAFDVGREAGYWAGYIDGAKKQLVDMEAEIGGREVTVADVKRARQKLVH